MGWGCWFTLPYLFITAVLVNIRHYVIDVMAVLRTKNSFALFGQRKMPEMKHGSSWNDVLWLAKVLSRHRVGRSYTWWSPGRTRVGVLWGTRVVYDIKTPGLLLFNSKHQSAPGYVPPSPPPHRAGFVQPLMWLHTHTVIALKSWGEWHFKLSSGHIDI